MLVAGGAEVEVFAAGIHNKEPAIEFGVKVHRFDVDNRNSFARTILPFFAKRHRELPFDVLESPEIGAEGSLIARAFPELAIVVKLHTPGYLVTQIGYEAPMFSERLRFSLGALRRGRWSTLRPPSYVAEEDPECLFTRAADEVAAPSRSISDRLTADWGLDTSRISNFPLPYEPSPELLALPLPHSARTIGFLGRLEARKGIVELAKAIPVMLAADPGLKFRLIGPTWPYRKNDMESWIRSVCRNFLDRIEFVGAVSKQRLPIELGQCDIMVLPSRWESFGFVCPEAMAAGRAVIGSSAGGMSEIIEPGVSGLLVKPNSPAAIVNAVLSLSNRPDEVVRLGAAGRERVLQHLSAKDVFPHQMRSYQRAIYQAHARLNAV